MSTSTKKCPGCQVAMVTPWSTDEWSHHGHTMVSTGINPWSHHHSPWSPHGLCLASPCSPWFGHGFSPWYHHGTHYGHPIVSPWTHHGHAPGWSHHVCTIALAGISPWSHRHVFTTPYHHGIATWSCHPAWPHHGHTMSSPWALHGLIMVSLHGIMTGHTMVNP